jgi:hypothetical protein
MKHLSIRDKNKIIIEVMNRYNQLLNKEYSSLYVHRINTTEVRMMAVLGTNFQEGYVHEHIVALTNYIMDKCNEHH